MPVKQSNESDMQAILGWLEEEYKADDYGFFCNRKVIQSHLDEQQLYVFLDESQCVVGFITGPTTGPSILSVKQDLRKQGIGRQLAEFMIEKARTEDLCVMHIQCEPQASVPFWENMGFEAFPKNDQGDIYASLVLEKPHSLPNGEDVPVSIKFYPESKQDGSNVDPLSEAKPKAVCGESGLIILEKRVIFNRKAFDRNDIRDPVVVICVDGEEIYCGKAKRDEADEIGVKRQGCHAFYIDRIRQAGESA